MTDASEKVTGAASGDGSALANLESGLQVLRAIAESTRLRLLCVLACGEFNVSELTQIMQQSQPRISRHLRLLTEAGLLERHKEGSWVLFRLREDGPAADLARDIIARLPEDDPVLAADRRRLEQVRRERAEAAAAYFAGIAGEWDNIRSLHVSEAQVETAMQEMAGPGPWDFYLDLGTGTGRILELFAPRARHALGVDTSLEMLAIARARLDAAGLQHAHVRRADIYDLPLDDDSVDFATMHQVLHYLDEPAAALFEVARVLRPGGRLLLVDFAPHELEFLREEHAHRRLGIATDSLARWVSRAGMAIREERTLPPPPEKATAGAGLTVSLWRIEKLAEA